jgi:hypothetical protein
MLFETTRMMNRLFDGRSSAKITRKRTKLFLLSLVLMMIFCALLLTDQIYRDHVKSVKILVNSDTWRDLHSPKSVMYYPESRQCLENTANISMRKFPAHFAFVFGGLGGFAQLESFKCLLAMESLINVAGYEGDVYFITEKNSCVPTEQELRNRIGYDKLHIIYKENYISKTATPSDQKSKNVLSTYLQDMSIKMDIFKYLPEKVQIAAWYDCDVVFGVHNCAKNNLLCSIPTFSSEVSIYITKKWHVGSFMVHRKYSQKMLEDWKLELFKGVYASDYIALEALYRRQRRTQNEWGVRYFTTRKTGSSYSSDTAVLVSDPTMGENYSSWRDVIFNRNTPNSCIMHLTTGRCSEKKNGHVATDALV